MTETRQQWIEREAREARARFRSGNTGEWEDLPGSFRHDWRNVVAPFYPAPLRVPVDVEGLAKALYEAPNADGGVWEWDEAASCERESRINEARAALAFLNIEPCAAPEYNPDDVALTPNERAELENLRAECKRLANDLLADRNHAELMRATKQSVVNIQDKTIKAMRHENAKLRVEASEATAKAERQRKQLHSQCKTIESRGAEIARLENEVKRLRHNYEVERDRANDLVADRNFAEAECERLKAEVQRGIEASCDHLLEKVQDLNSFFEKPQQTKPVKVRFDVELEDLAAKIHHALHGGWPELSQEGDRTKAVWIDTAKIAMDYLASHAVIDAPAGLPSVEALVLIGRNAYQRALGFSEYKCYGDMGREAKEGDGAFVVAVRDAILAAMPQPREWSEDDVKALAKMIEKSYWDDDSGWRDVARAALQWFDGKRGEV